MWRGRRRAAVSCECVPSLRSYPTSSGHLLLDCPKGFCDAISLCQEARILITGASDTSPEAERILLEGYRRMSPTDRLGRVLALNRALEQLAEARIRATHGPDLPERELRLRLAALRLDRDTMIRVFGWDPQEKGY